MAANGDNLGQVTVFQAIEWDMADYDDPLLCWGGVNYGGGK